MEVEALQKKSFLKSWWFWVILILLIGIILLGITAYSGHKNDEERFPKTKEGVNINRDYKSNDQTKAFTDEEMKAAGAALAAGITVEDQQNDWIKIQAAKEADGRANNPNAYPLSWTDWKSVSLGADQTYLYVKYRFWENLPKALPGYNSDQIAALGTKVDSFSFTRSDGQKDSADLADNISWMGRGENNDWTPLKTPMLSHTARITPTGVGPDNEMGHKTQTSAGLIGGGPGFDYIIAAYPLSLFDIKLGSEITFDGMMEVSSELYHHEAVDLLQQEACREHQVLELLEGLHHTVQLQVVHPL